MKQIKLRKIFLKKIIKKITSLNFRKISMCILCISLTSIFLTTTYGAVSTPSLVTKLNSALNKIQSYLVKIAIAGGVLIRKLSFGNEEKMVLGKKVIVNAILSYGIILSIDLILKFVEAVIK